MKIAIVSKGNPQDIKTWSGIPYYIYYALQKKGYVVNGFDLVDPQQPWHYRWYRYACYKLSRKWFWHEMEPRILKKMATQFDGEVSRINPDVVPLIHGHFLAYTTFKQPAVVVHDTTFAQIIDYYSEFTKLTPRSINWGNIVYQRGLDRASAAIFSSSWATQSAIADYEVAVSKVYTIPFGANLSSIPELETVAQWIARRSSKTKCHFLFLGVEWERKGGPDALRFVVELNRLGLKSVLTVIGCCPAIPAESQHLVNQVGFLRKNVKTEFEKLEHLFTTSTALLLSIAECYGCVYCEANAYGLRALGRDTGGVSEIIKDGVNGLLMGPNESPEAFAQRWVNLWHAPNAYYQLSLQSREEFDDRLNYDVFVNKLEEVIAQLDA